MNAKARVVIERYPTARLPAEIREKLNFGSEVRIEVQPVAAGEDVPPISAILDAVTARRKMADDPVARIRAIREEWATRDEQVARIRAGNAE